MLLFLWIWKHVKLDSVMSAKKYKTFAVILAIFCTVGLIIFKRVTLGNFVLSSPPLVLIVHKTFQWSFVVGRAVAYIVTIPAVIAYLYFRTPNLHII